MITKRTQLAYLGKQINWSSPQTQGLVSQWALNDGGGLTVRSACGCRNGTLTNFPANPWTSSPIGRALTFDGTDDYIANCEIGNEFAFPNTTFSVSVRFKSTVGGMLCAKDGSAPTGKGWFVYVETSTGIINIQFKGSAGNAFVATTSGTSFIDGKWHHLVAVITTSTTNLNNNNAIVYVDGVNRSLTYTRSAVYESPTVAFTIGKRNGTLPFNGSISDFRLYNRALSAAEAQDIYVKPLGIYQPIYKQIYFPETAPSSHYTRMLMGVGL